MSKKSCHIDYDHSNAAFGSAEELLQGISVATICFDSQGSYICSNRAFRELFSVEDIGGNHPAKEQVAEYIQNNKIAPQRIHEKGSFGAEIVPQNNLTHLNDGRIVQLQESHINLSWAGEVCLQQWIDHTPVSRAFGEIESELNMLLELINQVPDQIYFKDIHSRFIRINPALAKRYGIDTPSEAVGKSDADYYSREHAELTRLEELEMMREGEPVFNQLHQEIWDDGSESWNVSTKMPMFNAKGEIIGLSGISHDITEHKRREADAWQQANYDGLTNLANRNYFFEQLQVYINRAKHQGSEFAVMLLDLDRFKEVNDTLGHGQGDLLLVHTAQRMQQALRESDLVGRLGGDEFGVIVEFTDIGQLQPLLERLLAEIEKPLTLQSVQVSVSASIGIALFPQDATNADELLSRADEAMYSVKEQGRSGYSLYSAELSEVTKRRLRLASDLRAAIGSDQISLCYQPVVAASYDRIVGAEALCRWHHPELGDISPSEFIPLAEQTGLIQRLEDFIIDSVLQQLVRINSEDVSPIRMSINISPRRIMRAPERLKNLAYELDELGIYRSQLVLEVTEGLLLDATDDVLDLVKTFYDQGFAISLDDFGTGYCALSYLMHLDIHQVKIDRTFVERVDTDDSSHALCASIVSLAKTLGLTVVAEGVEKVVQRDLLGGLGCDYYQGYLFSRPLSSEAFMSLLDAQWMKEHLELR